MSVIDVVEFNEDKEPTLGEQIDLMIACGNDLAPKVEAFRRILLSRIKGATLQSINELPFTVALGMVPRVIAALEKANQKHKINTELMSRILNNEPKGPGQ